MEIVTSIINGIPLLESPFAWCVPTEENDAISVIQGIISSIINLIKIVVPIALVILGMLDLGKAVMSQKEDDIKKGQSTFLKRLIAAVVVFLVVFVVQVVITFFLSDEGETIWDCVERFING